jgi:hypothetical protein
LARPSLGLDERIVGVLRAPHGATAMMALTLRYSHGLDPMAVGTGRPR